MNRTLLTTFILSLGLAGCASVYTQGEQVHGLITAIWTEAAFDEQVRRASPAERAALLAAVPRETIRAGRAVQYTCADGTDSSIVANAVVPAGMSLAKGDTALVEVGDSVRVPNMVIARITDPQRQKLLTNAYTFIPDWRERGLWQNFERTKVEPWVERHYERVYGSFLIRCRIG